MNKKIEVFEDWFLSRLSKADINEMSQGQYTDQRLFIQNLIRDAKNKK